MNLKLARKNRETNPESWEQLYGHMVTNKIRKLYSQNQIEAILNNYIAEPTNEKYAAEFKALQEYRKKCKAEVKEELGIDESTTEE